MAVTARSNTGTIRPIIKNIEVTKQPSTMQINTDTIIFTPQNQNELSGSMVVYAEIPNCPTTTPPESCKGQQTFYWQSSSSSGFGSSTSSSSGASDGIMKFIIQTIPQILSTLNSGGDISSIFSEILGGFLNQNNSSTTPNNIGGSTSSNVLNLLGNNNNGTTNNTP